jgi:hypothetical protein
MEAILILKIFAMAVAVLLVGIGLEKAIRWGEREGIVKRGYAEDASKAFREGDRVVAIGMVDGIDLCGLEGTVVFIEAGSPYPYGVEFDEPIHEGHSCYGVGKSGFCRFGRREDFRGI